MILDLGYISNGTLGLNFFVFGETERSEEWKPYRVRADIPHLSLSETVTFQAEQRMLTDTFTMFDGTTLKCDFGETCPYYRNLIVHLGELFADKNLNPQLPFPVELTFFDRENVIGRFSMDAAFWNKALTRGYEARTESWGQNGHRLCVEQTPYASALSTTLRSENLGLYPGSGIYPGSFCASHHSYEMTLQSLLEGKPMEMYETVRLRLFGGEALKRTRTVAMPSDPREYGFHSIDTGLRCTVYEKCFDPSDWKKENCEVSSGYSLKAGELILFDGSDDQPTPFMWVSIENVTRSETTYKVKLVTATSSSEETGSFPSISVPYEKIIRRRVGPRYHLECMFDWKRR